MLMVLWQAESCTCSNNEWHHPSTHDYLNPKPVDAKQDVCFYKTTPHQKSGWHSLPPASKTKELSIMKQSWKKKE